MPKKKKPKKAKPPPPQGKKVKRAPSGHFDPAAGKDMYMQKRKRLRREQTEGFGLLAWWKGFERRAPNLARMAKQLHGAPTASAGVERVSSSAGIFHGDKSKQQDVGLLKALLFASYY